MRSSATVRGTKQPYFGPKNYEMGVPSTSSTAKVIGIERRKNQDMAIRLVHKGKLIWQKFLMGKNMKKNIMNFLFIINKMKRKRLICYLWNVLVLHRIMIAPTVEESEDWRFIIFFVLE
ncbi:hypothetical protein ACH5RR_017850 [Cinchona calisaya]|uniref:Uncharacterized protein n=1 Tax=Cinchona calisaya TaxID=153742 RepID=A0ABD2ZLH8_9GENT